MRKMTFLTATALSALIATNPVYAQTQSKDAKASEAPKEPAHATAPVAQSTVQDIVVTAQRRAQNVQDVPVAVSAFDAAQLQTRNVANTLDLAEHVPNMFGANNTGIGSANVYYLRGIGNTESIATFDPPIGTYIDDVYISRQNANNFSMFDVQRVEVLRGPQGTLFGRNTTGGAINMIMAEPKHTFGGYLEANYGRFDKRLIRGSVDVPISDMLAVKLSAYWQKTDGYVKDITTGEHLNVDNGSGLRAAAKFTPTNNVTWNVAVAQMSGNSGAILNFDCNPADLTECDGRYASTGLRRHFTKGVSQFAPLPISGRKAFFSLGNRVDTTLVTSKLGWELGDQTLDIVTGVVDLTQKYALDFFDGRGAPSLATPFPPVRGFSRGGFTYLNDGKTKEFTQEVKLSGKLFGGVVNYVSGIYYFHEYNKTDFAGVFTLYFPGLPGNQLPLLLGDRTLVNKTNAWAGYTQVDVHPIDKVTLTAGVRYTDEVKKLSISDNRPSCATPGPACLDNQYLIAANGRAIPRKLTTKLWTPRFAINYKPNRNVMLFASATEGFKSGGWNARATKPGQLLPFGPEKAWSYEGGIKSDWFDHRLRINLTAYDLHVSGLQTPSAFINPDGSISFITRNFANLRNRGLELEMVMVPVSGLNVFFNAGTQDAHYVLPKNASAVDEYGVTAVAAQQQACFAELAAGLIPGASGADKAASCQSGIVLPDGSLARPVRTPKLSLSTGFSYDIDIPSAGITLTPEVNVSYLSTLQTGTAGGDIHLGDITGPTGTVYPANPYSGPIVIGSTTQAHALVNAGLTLRTDDGKWLFGVDCNNCLNRSYRDTSLFFNYLNRPMSWSLRTKYNF